MRQNIAWCVCILTLVIVVGLALRFASAHNPRIAPKASPSLAIAPASRDAPVSAGQKAAPPQTAGGVAAIVGDRERGRAVFERESCATCHAIADAGNPRNPLDGVGARLSPAELRSWITGTGGATARLSPGITKRKQRYLSLPEEELNALVAFLSGLTNEAGTPSTPP